MLTPVYPKRFQKSLTRCAKRGYDMERLKEVINLLITETPLPFRCRPHKLVGNFAETWECHIQPDWLLVYWYDYKNGRIIFEDTGTHSDLF